MMIVSIRHKGLKLLWTNNNPAKLPTAQIKKIRMVLTLLNGSVKIDDMDFPGSGLHQLKGDLKDFWAVTISANYRIIFRFEDEDAHDVDYIDYH